MNKNRLEAFSDGVLAIIITIMVLEFKVPSDTTFEAILPLFHKFLSYILSFVYVGIYWNNHHHLMHAVKRVNGSILLGQPSFIVLAFLNSVYNRMDWRTPLCSFPDDVVRNYFTNERHRVLYFTELDSENTRQRIRTFQSNWQRSKRKSIRNFICNCSCFGSSFYHRIRNYILNCSLDVANSR